ncbi:hypothetical protein [Corynebacterium diphtheriae]|uniref:hypothetical protein n=1 Tax=Corynebacterium diphtheriae TaxID=1717 RepID=UPI000EABC10A|nr:hypothetical protein [Corynebacterium diphtheriae]RKW93948.1 hypothetical protein D9B51_09885 [Corynebacterium diphtheriae]
MFKRSLASLAVVAVASGAVVAPANAITVTVNDDMCTITPTAEEARLTNLTQGKTLNLKKENAATIKKTVVDGQLPALKAEIAKYEQDLTKPGLDMEKMALKSKLEEKRKQLTAYEKLSNALEACAAGNNYNSDQSDDPKRPDDSNPPSVPKRPGGPKQPDDSNPPSVPNPPEDSVKPDGKRALPSINGAVIGAIVAVLGILVAALPFIKSMLPAQLRALLP